ncbi:hypothetical protein GEMRC1_010523 [Eukaryota sp. GEM-RC1]
MTFMTNLNPAAAQAAAALLSEAIEKIGFLTAVTPDVISQRDKLAHMIGAEVAKTMEHQKKLEEQYQKLLIERSQLLGCTDKRFLDEKKPPLNKLLVT